MNTPLADRIRPSTLDEVVGQRHILGEGKALRNIMESGRIPNLIFYGPSGVGKTTVARIIAQQTDIGNADAGCQIDISTGISHMLFDVGLIKQVAGGGQAGNAEAQAMQVCQGGQQLIILENS